jgi:glycosyltransferase involved in cell wall biosynthesis
MALLNDVVAVSDAHFRRRILAVGPGEGFVTGQSVAFLTYTGKSRHAVSIVNTNDEGRSLLLHVASSIRVIVLAAWALLYRTPQCVYLSTSRSKLGAIKDIAVIALARLVKVPVVNHLHGITFASFRESLGPVYGSVVDWAYGYISASIVLHQKLIAQYARYPGMKISVVNNFVDADISDSSASRNRDDGSINVLFLSNLVPEKGLFELIDSVKSLLAQHPTAITLKLAGRYLPGAGMSSREVEVKFLQTIAGLSPIQYCGFADATEKKELLAWAHVLALPSYMKEEAAPLAVLEGMAAGCYLIVSDFGVLPDLVQDATATVVPARDRIALQNALAILMENPNLLRTARLVNPKIAQERFSVARYVSAIDGILLEISGEVTR